MSTTGSTGPRTTGDGAGATGPTTAPTLAMAGAPAPAGANAAAAAAARQRLRAVIQPRPRATALWSVLLALAFALVVSATLVADRAADVTVAPGQPVPVTVRVPAFAGQQLGDLVVAGGGVLAARGDVLSAEQAAAVTAVRAHQAPGLPSFVATFAILFGLAWVYSHHLRRSPHGRHLRVQVINLATLAVVAIAAKVLLVLTPLSVLIVPVALASIIPTVVLDRVVGLATGVLAALVLALLVPFDLGTVTVLLATTSLAGLVVPERKTHTTSAVLLGALAAVAGAGASYAAYMFLATGRSPLGELASPTAAPWLAALAGGGLALALAVIALPLYQLLVGEITHGALVRLEDLANPLLRQIATNAPGSWQHSLAMANMADIAAGAIGANGRLVRVGAYYHDLGKSLQPKYFIENLEPGEPSPHDRLAPEVSCDAIFAHVTEGLVHARRAKLPERIVDFMHMHHGDGVLEYFWGKCQEQGNPRGLTVEDFRYPGMRPQSRETAILAICDAVEAAARTLKRGDDQSVGALVQRIVYGKLHLGQLDDSGLSMADLRRLSDALRETIKHARHGRIEYPWQREAAAQDASAAPSLGTSGSGLLQLPQLDSLDGARPPGPAGLAPRSVSSSGPIRTEEALTATQPATPVTVAAAGASGQDQATAPAAPPEAPAEAAPALPAAAPADAASIDLAPPGPGSTPPPLSPRALAAAESSSSLRPKATLPGVQSELRAPSAGASGQMVAEADVIAEVPTSPSRPKLSALIVDDEPPGADEARGDDAAATRPRMAALPLPAPPPSNPAIELPTNPTNRTLAGMAARLAADPGPPPVPVRDSPSSPWSSGLAARIEASLGDEFAVDTPVRAPDTATLASAAERLEQTRQTPLHEIEALVSRSRGARDGDGDDDELFQDEPARPPPPASGRARRARDTEEVELDAVEAEMDMLPRAKGGPPPATRPAARPQSQPIGTVKRKPPG